MDPKSSSSSLREGLLQDTCDVEVEWKRPRPKSRFWKTYYFVGTVSFVTGLAFATLFLSLNRHVMCSRTSQRASLENRLPKEMIPDSPLEDLSGSEVGQNAWANLTDGVAGFLFVQDSVTALPGKKFPTDEGIATKVDGGISVGISMFHQLHCLQLIRDMFIENLNHGMHDRRNEHPLAHHETEHIGHCFSYLAQNILCTGDTTLEMPHVQRNEKKEVTGVIVDGYDAAHECKDLTTVFDISRKTQADRLGTWVWNEMRTGGSLEEVFDRHNRQ